MEGAIAVDIATKLVEQEIHTDTVTMDEDTSSIKQMRDKTPQSQSIDKGSDFGHLTKILKKISKEPKRNFSKQKRGF